jgi:hypothetical protein
LWPYLPIDDEHCVRAVAAEKEDEQSLAFVVPTVNVRAAIGADLDRRSTLQQVAPR